MDIAKVEVSVLASSTSWPASMLGETGPKPIPYRTISSPALAGREVTPEMTPTGSTNVPSANSATAYCIPPMMNDGGASRPGSVALTVGVKGALVPPGVETTAGCAPSAVLDGAWTLTCKGLA